MIHARSFLLALTLVAGSLSAAAPDNAEPVEPTGFPTDPRTGLVMAPGWELVNAHCGACHSHRLVTAQRGDADFWLSVIRWMQKTQNLWQIPPDQEGAIIDYLATNYSESEWGRRPPLPASLMPPPVATGP